MEINTRPCVRCQRKRNLFSINFFSLRSKKLIEKKNSQTHVHMWCQPKRNLLFQSISFASLKKLIEKANFSDFDFVLKVAAHDIDRIYPEGWGINFDYNIPHTCSNRVQRRVAGLSGTQIIKWILYDDNMVVFAKTVDEAEQILEIISNTSKQFGFSVSFGQTRSSMMKTWPKKHHFLILDFIKLKCP